VRFEVPTGLWLWRFLNSTIMWDLTPCSPVELHLSFGVTYTSKACLPTAACCLLDGLTLLPRRRRQYVSPTRRWTSTGLHSATSQMIVPFIVTAVRTSNKDFCCWDVTPCSLVDRYQCSEGISSCILRLAENGSNRFLQHVSICLPNYTSSHDSSLNL
jgi:hypothetical protein